MINLIKNELYKLFKKKTIYIFLAILLAFIIFISVLTRATYVEVSNFYSIENDLQYEYDNLDEKRGDYLEEKVRLKSQIHFYKFHNDLENYKSEYAYEVYLPLLEKYYNSIFIFKDLKEEKKYLNEITKLEEFLKTEDRYFFNEHKLTSLKNELTFLENSGVDNKPIDKEVEYLKHKIKLYEFRLENPKEEEFLDMALYSLEWDYIEYDRLINKTSLDRLELTSLEHLKKDVTINKYLVENKLNLEPGKELRDSLTFAHEDYVFLLILFVIMISAGIFSEEFNKGTIKNLLTKPFKRTKILFAKYITTIIAYLFIIVSLYVFVLLVNGIMFGFEGLTLPVLEYNYTTDKLLVLNVFKAVLINIIYITPFILFLSTFAFFLSLLVHSTAFATTVSFGAFIAGEIINVLAITKNIEPLKYFITLNWDFSVYQYGASNPFNIISFKFSLIIYLIYFTLLILFSVMIFRKKDIKNI